MNNKLPINKPRNKYLKKQKTNKINTDHIFVKINLKHTLKQQEI
ncbi:hypothetical protein VCRA2123E76_120040 [Vibrio crassostreae]|nr:hypothetical protein VCRA2123E76_120040 [Vibrio crassostreae]